MKESLARRMNVLRAVIATFSERWYAGFFSCGVDAATMMVYMLSQVWYANRQNDAMHSTVVCERDKFPGSL